jgi:branched-chain amino acid transport system permease protein
VHVEPSDLRLLLFGVALVLVMRWRPAGLWPSAIRRREFAPGSTPPAPGVRR